MRYRAATVVFALAVAVLSSACGYRPPIGQADSCTLPLVTDTGQALYLSHPRGSVTLGPELGRGLWEYDSSSRSSHTWWAEAPGGGRHALTPPAQNIAGTNTARFSVVVTDEATGSTRSVWQMTTRGADVVGWAKQGLSFSAGTAARTGAILIDPDTGAATALDPNGDTNWMALYDDRLYGVSFGGRAPAVRPGLWARRGGLQGSSGPLSRLRGHRPGRESDCRAEADGPEHVRAGEALGLRWEDVDLAAGTLSVRHALQRVDGRLVLLEPKTRRSRRTLHLPQIVVDGLRRHRGPLG